MILSFVAKKTFFFSPPPTLSTHTDTVRSHLRSDVVFAKLTGVPLVTSYPLRQVKSYHKNTSKSLYYCIYLSFQEKNMLHVFYDSSQQWCKVVSNPAICRLMCTLTHRRCIWKLVWGWLSCSSTRGLLIQLKQHIYLLSYSRWWNGTHLQADVRSCEE